MPFLTVIAVGGGGGWLLFLLAGARGLADPSWPFNQITGPIPSICAVTLMVELLRVRRSRARSFGTLLTALVRTIVAMVVYSALYAAVLWVYDMAVGNALAHGLIPPVTRQQYDYLRWLGPVVSLLLVVVLLYRRLNAPQPEDGHDRGVLDTLSNVYEGAEKTSDICQCRLNFPQKRRLKIPHFVLCQSRP